MRLLNIYTLQLDEFFGNDIPPYFILSHRWEGEEITYKDFVKGRRQDSPGYKKILAFCEYAKVLSRTEFVEAWMRKYGNVDQELDCTVEVLGPAGLWSKTRSWYNKAGQVMDPQGPVQWIWVDTCKSGCQSEGMLLTQAGCIDKRSSAELSEAINSMFAWYAGALACVAYLSDVHVPHMEDIPDDHTQGTEGIPDDDVQDDMDGIPDKDTKDTGSTSDYGIYKALKKSLWFTRGWTLQELLAPPLVIFCDSQWNVLGYLNKPTFHAEHPEVQRAHAYHLQPTLEGEISRITNIDVDYLADDPEDEGALTIGVASVAERMSWAAMRETTRIEDTAYCLWGNSMSTCRFCTEKATERSSGYRKRSFGLRTINRYSRGTRKYSPLWTTPRLPLPLTTSPTCSWVRLAKITGKGLRTP